MNHTPSNYDLQVDAAKRIFLGYDQQTMIRKFRLDADDTWLRLDYLNTPCRIRRADGTIEELVGNTWHECRSYSTVMTIYDLLCYHQGPNPPTLTGQWCTVGNFIVTGVQNTGTFTKGYSAVFDGHLPELRGACDTLGGTLLPAMAGADVTCRFPVTSFFPVLLQFWAGDDEFPPKLMLLWDRSADKFLHFETTFFLQGDLLQRLKAAMTARREPQSAEAV